MQNASISRRNLIKGTAAAAATMAVANIAVAEEAPAANRVCEILGIEKPVVQAIMFDMTNAELVAAVSNAGGLGVLSMTMPEQVDEVLALTDKPFAVSPAMADEETAQMLKDKGITIICAGTVEKPYGEGFMFGPEGIAFWKEQGFTVLCKALNVTLDGAIAIQEAGADILLLPWDYREAFDAVLTALRQGRISEARLDESVERILRLKQRFTE